MGRPNIEATPHWIIEHLSERDLEIVRMVGQFKLASTLQIQRVYFANMRTCSTGARLCRRVLERLVRDKVLTRLERRIGGVRAGSASFIYALGSVGQQIESDYKSHTYSREPSNVFIDHTLAITEIYVKLRESTVTIADLESEPNCWRPYGFAYGGKEVLKPDLFTKLQHGYEELSWFVEVDRSTEHREAINRKLKAYVEYFNTGIEQSKHEIFPQVLWVVPDEKRKEWLKQLIKPFNQQIEGLFAVCLERNAIEVLRDYVPP
jgi:hypothetical protein